MLSQNRFSHTRLLGGGGEYSGKQIASEKELEKTSAKEKESRETGHHAIGQYLRIEQRKKHYEKSKRCRLRSKRKKRSQTVSPPTTKRTSDPGMGTFMTFPFAKSPLLVVLVVLAVGKMTFSKSRELHTPFLHIKTSKKGHSATYALNNTY